ncbi:MAG TPA: FG-GAP-like repeat-containing protein [Pyrinomonadaceae bacterium]|nr:FG-GAP-like repeat-containing protein [Pyrinomonadaceae bacterium]
MFSPSLVLRLFLPSTLVSVLLVLTISAGIARAQSFSTPTDYALGDNPNSGIAADFNGDGKLDLAIGNVLHKNVAILINTGNGTFAGAVNYTVDFNPETCTAADFNGDGKLDLVVGNFLGGPTSGGTMSVLIGNGDGTFQAAVTTAIQTPFHVVATDLNADGKKDIVAASPPDKVSVRLGNGNGTFQAPVTYAVPDVPRTLAIADFNGDNKIDVVVSNSGGATNALSRLLGNGDGTLQAAVPINLGFRPQGVVAGDLNGDTKPDLVVADTNGNNVAVLVSNGNGTFQGPVTYPTGLNQPLNLALADFNGDGKLDVVTPGNFLPNAFSILRGVGDGTLQAFDQKASRNNSFFPIAADFDGDGKPDLALVNNAFDLVDVFLNSPSAKPVNITASQGVAATVLVATFIDYDNTKTAASFTASINWGDGTSPSAGTVTANGSGGFNVTGTHTYLTPGIFNVETTVADTNNNFAKTTSTATVKATTTTAVSSSVNPSDFSQSVTFTATVTSGGGTPTGSVQFKDNGTNLGTAVSLNGSGVATVSTSSLSAGTHTITAEYGGAATFDPSTGTLAGGQVVRPIPTLSINDLATTEGDSGTKSLNFTVTLSAASNLTVIVDFATADSSANAGSDYVAATGGLTFNPGDTTKTVTVTINGDTTNEPDETFVVNLTNAVNATVSDSQGVGTLVNDDAPVLLIDTTTGRAAALDSVHLTRDEFSLLAFNLGLADQRRRISLFVWRLQLLPSDTAANLTVTAEDGVGGVYTLPVEHISQFSAVPDVTQVIVRLPDIVVGAPRDLSVRVQLRGPASNSAIIKIAAP